MFFKIIAQQQINDKVTQKELQHTQKNNPVIKEENIDKEIYDISLSDLWISLAENKKNLFTPSDTIKDAIKQNSKDLPDYLNKHDHIYTKIDCLIGINDREALHSFIEEEFVSILFLYDSTTANFMKKIYDELKPLITTKIEPTIWGLALMIKKEIDSCLETETGQTEALAKTAGSNTVQDDKKAIKNDKNISSSKESTRTDNIQFYE